MPLGAAWSEKGSHDLAFEPVAFSDLPGWSKDDHLAAFQAFAKSAPALERSHPTSGKTRVASETLIAAVSRAAAEKDRIATPEAARAFFEAGFLPHRLVHRGAEGLLTGYYEPVLAGSRTPGGPFRFPVYRRPPDLVNLVAEEERGALAGSLTHARKTAAGETVPYATRAEIENGALAGQGLELVWLADPVDTFFMHVQGSGRIRLPDGEMIRVTYDGKNGHPYTSIGRYLIDAGLFPANDMSLDALKVWLAADPERGRAVMQENKSFVFFRELASESPLGALSIPLSTGRSLAVDTAFHAIGTPVYVMAPGLDPWGGHDGFNRLMIAQDVGSAIRGPERGDIYFGSGDEAGRWAGTTKHAGRFIVLLPRAPKAP